MAAPAAPGPQNRIELWQGHILLCLARLIQRLLAGRRTRLDVALRNWAMRGAHARGIDPRVITRAVGLSKAQVRKALGGKRPTGEQPGPEGARAGCGRDGTIASRLPQDGPRTAAGTDRP
ncbi:hypothetical protein [Streptomyces sp. NPDC056160]|uniref:hypothetical protein n=1 Tax=Streptomyces sp. NPDC056160 TaxID=3345731 RepID=UPI0035E29152